MTERQSRTRVTVVIPTYNERENIVSLLEEVLRFDGFRAIVVDDDSPDGTGDAAEGVAARFPGRVCVLHRKGRRGLGLSYVEGLAAALEEGTDIVCQMDADFSHDPKYLPSLVEAASRYDLVLGSRYVKGISVVNWPLRRLVLSTLANRYIRAVTGLAVNDCTGGFRCWRTEALARIPLKHIVSDGYAFLVEMLYEAARRGCRIGEVPIVFVERREGASKLSTAVLWESLLMPWRLRVRGLFRPA